MKELIEKNNEAETMEELNLQSEDIADEELENVAGGATYNRSGNLMVTRLYKCNFYEGRSESTSGRATCSSCSYSIAETFFGMLCNHPANQRQPLERG